MNKSCGTLLYSHNGYGCEDVDREGFVSLMDLYEINFMRFSKLVNPLGHQNLGEAGSSAVFCIDGCLDLHMEVLEHSRYTSTVCLTYRFIDAGKFSSEPNLVCRIYHDAGLVEVISGHLKHGREQHDYLPAESAKMKWQVNRFLYKWLGFCLYLGHHFSATSKPCK